MIDYYNHLWVAHEYSALLKCPGDCSCFAFNRRILALCVSSESATRKYNVPSIGTTHWRFSVGHVQYLCNKRKPMPSLLQSGARPVTLLMSEMVTPILTKLIMICLDCWNAFSRLSFQTKCVFFLTRSRNGSIMGLNEYAHATWLTSPNQDLASVIFLGVGKLDIAFNWLL